MVWLISAAWCALPRNVLCEEYRDHYTTTVNWLSTVPAGLCIPPRQYSRGVAARCTHPLIAGWMGWLIDWLIYWLIYWFIYWLIYLFIYLFFNWLVDYSVIDGLQVYVPELDSILEEWRSYKISVPTYGAIILNTCLDKVLLVQVNQGRVKIGWYFCTDQIIAVNGLNQSEVVPESRLCIRVKKKIWNHYLC